MAQKTIKTPDFNFSAFYYPQIYQSLIQFKRTNVPEITKEDERDPFMRLLQAFALVGHNCNTKLDAVAVNLTLPTATLREPVKLMLALIDYPLGGATPSTADVLLTLSRATTSDQTDFVPALSEFSTKQDANNESVVFESQEAMDLDRTDQIGFGFAFENTGSGANGVTDASDPDRFTASAFGFTAADVGKYITIEDSSLGNNGFFRINNFVDASNVDLEGADFFTETGLSFKLGAFTDYTADLITDSGTPVTPWVTPAAGDALYIGHPHIMWDQLDFTFDAPASGLVGVWEYFDPELSEATPDDVTDNSPNIEFELTTFLGADNAAGAFITVRYAPTGYTEEVYSTWNGSINIATTSLLGQSSVSVDVSDYVIGADWNRMFETDNTTAMTIDGNVTYTIPQSIEDDWQKTTINQEEAFWARFRIVTATAPVSPDIQQVLISEGSQYMIVATTQGQTVTEDPLASSTGLASQSYELTSSPYIDGSVTVTVDNEDWVEVRNFVNSGEADKHYTISVDNDDNATVNFGDGEFGKIPPSGVNNIKARYRVFSGGEESGNVGANKIVENSSGVQYVSKVSNPRPASGFKIKDGSTEEDLERVKIAGPASLRGINGGIKETDIRSLAEDFTAEDGTSPIARAFIVEEAGGPKTVGIICVTAGGGLLTASQIDEVEIYFNGDSTATPPTTGVIAVNNEAIVENYTRALMGATVTATTNSVTEAQIQNALVALFDPLHLESDGVTYTYQPEGDVAVSKAIAAIDAIGGIPTVSVTLVKNGTPVVGDAALNGYELPYPDLNNITINIVAP